MVLTVDNPHPRGRSRADPLRARPHGPPGDRAPAWRRDEPLLSGRSRSGGSPPRCAKAASRRGSRSSREGTPTAAAAAEATGAPIDQIVKSLVFACDGRPLVVMVPGDARADPARIAAVAGCERVKPGRRRTRVEQLTGFPPGGVAPFPLPGSRPY